MNHAYTLEILGCKLLMTCSACPEQYDVFDKDGHEIGYLRLRHGEFRADREPSGETVYRASPKGDGIFEPDERELYLTEAVRAILGQNRCPHCGEDLTQ